MASYIKRKLLSASTNGYCKYQRLSQVPVTFTNVFWLHCTNFPTQWSPFIAHVYLQNEREAFSIVQEMATPNPCGAVQRGDGDVEKPGTISDIPREESLSHQNVWKRNWQYSNGEDQRRSMKYLIILYLNHFSVARMQSASPMQISTAESWPEWGKKGNLK